MKKMMNINANKNIGDGGNENILGREEVTIVKESLRRELALSEPKLGLIREEVEGFEKRYEMSSDE
ncbi:MAG: hypothetical protein N2V75_12500, partial [Methanophagales archaeon]|nr:hypothetical protein [Methanophagales archaeon]